MADDKVDSKDLKRMKNVKNAEQTTSCVKPKPGCVVYLGRLPHGFYEEELRAYFSQFGIVSRLRLSRNRTSGASKHYAFMEFTQPEVAAIVVDTMHNYLLFGRLLQCALVPEHKLHEDMFKGANRKFTKIPWKKIAAERYNNRKEKDDKTKVSRRLERCSSKAQDCGIDYDFGSIVRKAPTA